VLYLYSWCYSLSRVLTKQRSRNNLSLSKWIIYIKDSFITWVSYKHIRFDSVRFGSLSSLYYPLWEKKITYLGQFSFPDDPYPYPKNTIHAYICDKRNPPTFSLIPIPILISQSRPLFFPSGSGSGSTPTPTPPTFPKITQINPPNPLHLLPLTPRLK